MLQPQWHVACEEASDEVVDAGHSGEQWVTNFYTTMFLESEVFKCLVCIETTLALGFEAHRLKYQHGGET